MEWTRRGMDSSFTLSLSLSLPPPPPPPPPLPVFSLRRLHYLSAWNRLVLPVLPRARIVPWIQEFHGLPLKKKKKTSFCFLFVACKHASRVSLARDFALYPPYGELARRLAVMISLPKERR